MATRKTKSPSESLENCATFDAGILNLHVSLVLRNILRMLKMQQQKNPTSRQASSVATIWQPLGQGSSLAPLRTTFDTIAQDKEIDSFVGWT